MRVKVGRNVHGVNYDASGKFHLKRGKRRGEKKAGGGGGGLIEGKKFFQIKGVV